MNHLKFAFAGQTQALEYAAAELQRQGCQLVSEPADFILTDVPVRSDLTEILQAHPDSIIIGGKLQLPLRKTIDLLEDPIYLAHNANITAHCAVKLLLQQLPVILTDLPILVVGWGRIGKCLAALLRNMGAKVSVLARKDGDNAILSALGYSLGQAQDLSAYRVIFNTAPCMVLNETVMQTCSPDCLKIDLASSPGIAGADVIWARGLPGKDAPESSGRLIAQRVLHRMKGVVL